MAFGIIRDMLIVPPSWPKMIITAERWVTCMPNIGDDIIVVDVPHSIGVVPTKARACVLLR